MTRKSKKMAKETLAQVELAFGKLEFGNEDQIAFLSLTEQQRRYLLGLLEGKSKKQSALDAGYSADVAKNPKHGIEKYIGLHRVEKTMADAFSAEGVTAELIAQRTRQVLDLTQLRKKKIEKGGYTVIEEEEVVDDAAVMRASDFWAKMTGAYAAEKSEVKIGSLAEEREAALGKFYGKK